MPLLKNLTNSKAKMYLVDEEEDDQRKLNAKDRDKKEREYFEQQKKREEARKAAMERVKKQKAEREAREKAAREQAAKEKKRSVGGSVGSGHRRNAGGGNGNSNSAPKGIGGVAQGLKSAAQRDAEEKAYYENKSTVTPIKSMHRAGKDDAGRYTDTDTGRNESSNEEKIIMFAIRQIPSTQKAFTGFQRIQPIRL